MICVMMMVSDGMPGYQVIARAQRERRRRTQEYDSLSSCKS